MSCLATCYTWIVAFPTLLAPPKTNAHSSSGAGRFLGSGIGTFSSLKIPSAAVCFAREHPCPRIKANRKSHICGNAEGASFYQADVLWQWKRDMSVHQEVLRIRRVLVYSQSCTPYNFISFLEWLPKWGDSAGACFHNDTACITAWRQRPVDYENSALDHERVP